MGRKSKAKGQFARAAKRGITESLALESWGGQGFQRPETQRKQVSAIPCPVTPVFSQSSGESCPRKHMARSEEGLRKENATECY